jgi:hypothetical protein
MTGQTPPISQCRLWNGHGRVGREFGRVLNVLASFSTSPLRITRGQGQAMPVLENSPRLKGSWVARRQQGKYLACRTLSGQAQLYMEGAAAGVTHNPK